MPQPSSQTHSLAAGDTVVHRFNPELGAGRVLEISERQVVAHFPRAEQTLHLALDSGVLEALPLREGQGALLDPDGEKVVVEKLLGEGQCRLADGREVEAAKLWPLPREGSPTERLVAGEIGSLADFANRLEGLHLERMRQADGLGSFLGGRIRIFAHQLHAAECATKAEPVRWLLADEVGLGKTVEACLIQSHLLRTGRVESVLVVAPSTLTIQWLGELWRKFHEVYVLLDDKRLADVAKDYGDDFNPFDTHRRAVISLELLVGRPRLVEQARQAGIDLLIVDEAHRLRRPEGHPGEPAYRAVAPLAEAAPNVLLLTATPMEDDAHGFLRLLELLHPEAFPEGQPLVGRLESGEPLPACTSVTRRKDLGGLPPRVPRPVELTARALTAAAALEERLLAETAEGPVQQKKKVERLQRAHSSGAALDALLGEADEELRELARRAAAEDPRLAWLAKAAPEWKRRGEKTLIFVSCRETLELLRGELSRRAQLKTGVFHEDLSAPRRDIEVAQFRLGSGPSLLISTECGGEGRNFEFCHRLVMFDLPWSPVKVEQRIGRLDRIGRRLPVEIVYFRAAEGLAADVARLFERIALFERPLEGLQRELRLIERRIAEAAAGGGRLAEEEIDELARLTAEGYERLQDAAYRQLHRQLYDAKDEPAILARIPGELESLTEDFVLGAADCLGLKTEPQRDETVWSIELAAGSLIEGLPGLRGGFSFLGSFDRETAVDDEMIDFYASGHPLVEGLLADLADSGRGRTALLQMQIGDKPGFGLVAIYRRGPEFEVVAVDQHGRQQPEWAARIAARPLRSRRVDARALTSREDWAPTMRRLVGFLDRPETPVAAAVLVVSPAKGRG